VSPAAERARQRGDVNILPTAIGSPERRERAGMFGNHIDDQWILPVREPRSFRGRARASRQARQWRVASSAYINDSYDVSHQPRNIPL
jgi:hypothetical protein